MDLDHGKDKTTRVWESDLTELVLYIRGLKEIGLYIPKYVNDSVNRAELILSGVEAKTLPIKM